jgi:SAM-dependent methyltransferase
MACPICDGGTNPLFTKNGCTIHACVACGHQFAQPFERGQHIARVYGDAYFQGDSAGYPDYLSEARLLRNRGRWYARQLKKHLLTGQMLDVGAAAGFILQGFHDCGWQGVGLEPNPRMAEVGRTRLGLNIQTGTLESWSSGEQFDLVSMIQVIAHFHDLRGALSAAARATRPGGHWLIETWNRASWTAWLLSQHWHEYSPPSVLHWFTPTTVRNLLRQHGFVQVAIGRPRKRLSGAHAKLLLRPRLDHHPLGFLVRPFLRFIDDGAELPYPAEDLFWGLYRKVDR